jgi:hypothetical protein
MEWNSLTGSVITLVAGLLTISAMFWGGQVFMNFLGDEAPGHAFGLAPSFADTQPQNSPAGVHAIGVPMEHDDAIRTAETARPAVVGRSGLS